MAVLLHDYSFRNKVCEDTVGGTSWNCKLYGNVSFVDGSLHFGKGGAYASLPKGVLGENKVVTIEILVSTFNNDRGWVRIFQFGESAQSNSNSLALDRIANNYNNNNRVGNIMLEYFPSGYHVSDSSEYQAYSDVKFSNQENLYIVARVELGERIAVFVNGTKFESPSSIPADRTLLPSSYNFIGRSLVRSQPGFLGSINRLRIWSGSLSDSRIMSAQKFRRFPIRRPSYRPTIRPKNERPSRIRKSTQTPSPTVSYVSTKLLAVPTVTSTHTITKSPAYSNTTQSSTRLPSSNNYTLGSLNITHPTASSKGRSTSPVTYVAVASSIGLVLSCLLCAWFLLLKKFEDERKKRKLATERWIQQEELFQDHHEGIRENLDDRPNFGVLNLSDSSRSLKYPDNFDKS